MKKIFFLAFFIGIFLNFKPSFSFAQATTAVGQCHGVSFPNENISWVYPSGEVIWKDLEPRRGVYNWTKLDEAIEKARNAGKKIWIQVLTDNPGVQTIPNWALEAGMRQFPDRYDPGKYLKDRPVQWDSLYLQFLEEILQEMALRYNSNPTVEAVLMMSGGHYGEMALHPKYYHWDKNPDIYNPQSPYVIEMARAVGETPQEFVKPLVYNSYRGKFDYYYVQNSKRLVDLYATTFSKPVVLQAGAGLSGDAVKVAGDVIFYAIGKYGSQIWLKQNGWGNWGAGDYYNFLFSQYKNRTRITREVGQPITFHNRTADENRATIDAVINAGASALCFQGTFFREPSSYYPGVNFSNIRTRLEQNYKDLYLPIAYYPTCKKSNGDANGDNQISLIDFEIWRSEFANGVKARADFNCDNRVSLVDFEIWRTNFSF